MAGALAARDGTRLPIDRTRLRLLQFHVGRRLFNLVGRGSTARDRSSAQGGSRPQRGGAPPPPHRWPGLHHNEWEPPSRLR